MSEPTPPILSRAAAELAGTFSLVLAGCGAIIVEKQTGALGHSGVALTFGLVILVMIATFGHLSGAHFNPAVTVAFALIRHFPWREVPVYVGGQLAGAALGAAVLRCLFGAASGLGVTVPSVPNPVAFAVEFLLTATLMLVITAVATDTRAEGQLAAIAIGATVAIDALWGGPVTGASMNPARSFGPALVSGVWQSNWIYWLAPLFGACAGAVFYQSVRASKPTQS